MIARLGLALAAGLLLVACGGDGGGRYDARVEAAREAIRTGDRGAALASLDELAADALRGRAEGEVSEAELAQVTALVEHARAQVDDELPEATTTTVTSTAPPTTAVPTTEPAPVSDVTEDGGDDEEDDEEKGRKRGKGRGDDGGDDDD